MSRVKKIRHIGLLAAPAGVAGGIATHFIGGERSDPAHFEYLREIAEHDDSPVLIANDPKVF